MSHVRTEMLLNFKHFDHLMTASGELLFLLNSWVPFILKLWKRIG